VSRYKKISLWVIGGLGVLFIFLAILMVLLPRFINLGPIREKILAELSQAVGGQVECERFDLSFLPRPHVTIDQARLSIPGKVSGNLASVTIHPRILPILMGKVRLASVNVAAPDLTVAVQGKEPDKIKEKSKPFSVVAILERVAPVFAVLASQAPSLRVRVENAKLRVSEDKQPVFECQDIQASMDLPANQVKVDVTGFAFGTDGQKDLQATLAGSPPNETRRQADKIWVIKGKGLRATFRIDGQKTTVSLNELKLDDPQINITGRLVMDQTPPQVSLELEGKEIDVDSTRDAAIALAGHVAVTRKIFHIVKGGNVPLVHLSTHGTSWHDLGKEENILIKGSMLEGKIFVPGADLDLEDVNGDVIISKGILEGKNLEARMGGIGGRQGTLKLGLEGENAPFHLDMLIQADMAQLHPVLKRLAANKSFGHEMDLIDNLEGHGTGRLVLGESTTSIKTRLDLSEFNLSGYYKRIPYPLEISGQDFSYDERTVHTRQLSGKLGKSSFSELSLGLDWGKKPYLEAKSPRLEIFLGEVYSWLASLDRFSVYLKEIKRVDGVVSLSELQLKGPLFQPEDWEWETRGEIRHLAADTSLLPGPIKVTGGGFDAIEDAAEQRFSFRDAHVTLLDASLSVSGVLGDFLKGLNETDITLRGKMGREATQWVSDAIGLPPEYHIRPPVSISQGHLVWDRGTATSFVGDLIAQNGPRVSLDILRNPDELIIKKLLVQDGDSHASLKLDLKHKDLSLEFAGSLTGATMDKLLVKNQFCHGWIKGEISAQILLDRPTIPKAHGELKGEDLILPLNLKVPLSIDSFSLNAMKDHLKVESAILMWGDDRMALGGSVKLLADGVVLDMDLSAENLEWDKVEEIMERDNREDDLAPEENQWDLPVGGILRFKTEHFKYDQFTWSPFYADISFADNGVDVAVTEANLCGISTPGILRISPQGLRLDLKPVSKDQDLAPTLTCLGDKKGLVTGKFDLEGEVMTEGKGEGWLKSLHGDLEFLANNGRIHRHGLLAKIFAFLNVAGIVSGQFPDITQEGFSYHSMKAKGSLQNGKLALTEGHIDSPSMEIACQGDIDLLDKELDLQYLVAPLKTVDLVVKKIPLVSDVLNGTLLSIPVKVTGPWADPKITALSPSAVGSGLLGIMKRTVQLPLKMIEPRAPEEKPN
jgi:hypothetical protein